MKKDGVYDTYGIVMNANDAYIEFVTIREITKYTRCYDDEGAVKDRDKDNVRLKDCPLDFYSGGQGLGFFVYADMNNLERFSGEECRQHGVRTVCDSEGMHIGISKFMYEEIRNHPWTDQPQKEKVSDVRSRRVADLESRFSFTNNDNKDMEFGE